MSNTTFNENQYLDNQSIISTGNDNINLHTGKLSMRFDIADMGSAAFPFTLALCYNKDAFTSLRYGDGWSLSALQYVELNNDPLLPVYAAYHDGTGQVHYFMGDLSNDIGGLELKLTTSDTGYTITDRSDSCMTFDSDGKLISIMDANENGISLEYTNGYLTSITDTFERTITLCYSSNYSRLASIIDPAERTTELYYNRGCLYRIAYPDNTSIIFTHDIQSRISTVTYADGTKTEYQYSTSTGNGIERVSKYPANSDVCEEFTEITCRGEYTVVKDRSGIEKVHVFDTSGRPTFVYERSKNDSGEIIRAPITAATSYAYSDKKCSFKGCVINTDEQYNLLTDGTFDNEIIYWDSGWDGEGRPMKQWLRLDTKLEQNIPALDISMDIGNTLMFSAWVKPKYAYFDHPDALKLCADVVYGKYEGTDPDSIDYVVIEETTVDHFSANYNAENFNWQYLSLPIQIDSNRTLDHICVYIDYSEIDVAFDVDNARLINALAVTSITEKGVSAEEDIGDDEENRFLIYNITVFGAEQTIHEKNTTHNGIYTTVTEKNSNYDAVRQTVTDLDGNSFVSYFEYDNKHNLIRSQNYRGIMTEHSYNSVGMPTLTKTYYYSEMNPSMVSVPAKAFITETAYDSTGEFPISVTDERDETIKALSSYNITKGLLTSATDPNENTTYYTYDGNNDLITKVSMSASNGGEYSVLYGYDKRRLTKITHNDFDYEFTYDAMGRAQTTKIAGVDFSTNSYTLTETTTVETTYADGEKMTVESDRHQNPIKRTYTDTEGNETVIATAEYDDISRPTKNVDNVANKCYTYKYNSFGNVTEEKINDAAFKEYEYDEHNRLTKTTFHNGTETKIYRPIYDKIDDDIIYADNAVVGVTLDNVFTHKSEHDGYGRVTEKNLTLANAETPIISDEITYISSDTRLTNMIASATQKLNGITQGTFSYTYDNNGNITEIRKNNSLIAKYTYDEMNQLVREDNHLLNKTYIFTYDTAGNILSKKTYNTVLTTTNGTPDSIINYTYASTGWKDQLVSFGGETITYDVLGNPTTYRGHTLNWGKLRQLNSFDSNTFTYNANGIRTSKNNITYTLDGTKILSETRPTGTIKYLHGMNGVIGFTYNGNTYYYEKNIQGDVTVIVDASGAIKAKYVYDAWGNHTVTLDTNGIGALNPIRYRSYYYDTETGLYYVSSRYYDPEIGRFINADAAIGQIGNVQGTNMFAYCFNNPVNMSDPTGNWPKLSTIFTVVAVAAVAVAAVAVTVATCGAAAPALAVAGGGIIGGISAGAATTAASVATGAMIVAGVSTAAAATSAVAEKAVEKIANRNNSVYVLKDDAGTVQYVGRTNNVDKRRAAHSANPARAGLEMEVIASGLNLPESRALEQAGMAYYHTINTANKMNNQINSVSPKYWGAFKELALGTLNYGWNQMSNEILYWNGN